VTFGVVGPKSLDELALRLERDRAEAVVDRDRWKAEADRLRKLFDAAGQGEHNVLALVDHYQREAFDANEALDLAFEMGRQKGRDQEREAVLRYLREQLPITGRSIAFYIERGDHLKEKP
jgi:hypothetical protein